MTALTSPRLTDLLRMRRFIDAEISSERRRLEGCWEGTYLRAAADLYGVTVEEITGPLRGDRNTITARQVACWLLRQVGHSYPVIAATIGRDHTTVMHACRVIDGRPAVKRLAEGLLAQVEAA